MDKGDKEVEAGMPIIKQSLTI